MHEIGLCCLFVLVSRHYILWHIAFVHVAITGGISCFFTGCHGRKYTWAIILLFI